MCVHVYDPTCRLADALKPSYCCCSETQLLLLLLLFCCYCYPLRRCYCHQSDCFCLAVFFGGRLAGWLTVQGGFDPGKGGRQGGREAWRSRDSFTRETFTSCHHPLQRSTREGGGGSEKVLVINHHE